MLTLDELKEVLPPNLRNSVTQSLTDKVNQFAQDPQFRDTLKDNVLSYTRVLQEGRFKLSDYISAVTYVSFKIMGFNNQESWKRTFPDRFQELRARGADDKEISAYVASFNKNKLVNLIFEQTMIPVWVLNQDAVQKAVNHQVWLMSNAKSEKVQQDAANSILTHLKKPEAVKHQIGLDLPAEANGMAELTDMLTKLAQQQQDLIAQGISTREIAHQKLHQGGQDTVDGTMKDVTPKKR